MNLGAFVFNTYIFRIVLFLAGLFTLLLNSGLLCLF
jgi:hypothetical protein